MSNRPNALAAVEPNVYRPRATKPSVRFPPPSPLKKQSDYQLVAPLASKSSRPATADAPAKVPATPQIKKVRKKLLCATPPAVLQDLKGKREYDRGRQLGEGGFARCFLVQNKDGVLFAAKTVSKKSLTSSKMRGKFFGELAVHKTMQHPNIVRFVEVFEDPENIYMILELCRNKSLMDMMRRRKRFTEPEVRFFMLQMMGALKYMHGRNVIHRDLKLGNIFLDENMNVKIGDFGLAALLVDENERKRTICGTPNYIAPEVLFGGKDGEGHSFEVDLWAVGIIMYAMLIGKPPFQSTDVDSIYKKIRQNSFEWPETVMVSQSAKALVNALLNRDPTARPSLDEIANHNFFKSGLFPRSIPVSAVREEPIWPSAGSTLAAVTASRAQWKRNYDEVARLAGVGIDSSGKPIDPVGERPGKPIDPVPMSRPPSAASAASNECADIGKLLEQKKEQDKQDAQKANGGYILPEALSPRDGHARMRNMGVLRNVPNRLAALRGTAMGIPAEQEAPPKAPTPVPEETEPEPSDEEMEEAPPPPPPVPAPAPRNRLIDRPPVRRTAFQEKPVEKVQPEMPQAQSSKSAEAVPPRRITRSHAAQQRAAAVEPLVQTKAPVVQPEVPVAQPLRPARRLVAAEARRPTSAIVQPEPPAPLFRAPSSTDVSAKERNSSERSSSGPDVIPFGATLSTRVGKAIPETTTSVVLSSLLPIVNNLTAFINGTIRTLPPQPFATVEAVRSFRRGEKNKSIFIKKWVDYTNKYGMAYMLSDGTCATLYNDNTSMIVDKIGGDRVEWITQSHAEPARTVNGHQETVFRRLATEMSVIKQRSNTSKSLKSKLMIWKRTSNYMNNCLGVTEHWGCDRKEAIREPTVDGLTNVLLWVTHYARLRRCVIFRLIDGTIQLNFVDHTKLILTSAGRTLRIVTKDNELCVMSLEEAFELCRNGDELATEFGLKQKVGYIKEILKAWYRNGRFPSDIDQKEGEPTVILGEA